MLPLTPSGHGAYLNASLRITRELGDFIAKIAPSIHMLPAGDTNLICFAVAEPGETLRQANNRTEAVIAYFRDSPALSVTRTHLGVDNYGELISGVVDLWGGAIDAEQLTVVRMVAMNPYLDSDAILEGIRGQLQSALLEALG